MKHVITWPPFTPSDWLSISVEGQFIGKLNRSLAWGITMYDPFQDEEDTRASSKAR